MKTSEIRELLKGERKGCCDVTEMTEADKNYVLDLETDFAAAQNFITELVDLLNSVTKRDKAVEALDGIGFLSKNQRIDILHTMAEAQKFLDQFTPVDFNDRDTSVLYAD